MADAIRPATLRVLVYSSDADTRAQVMLALGRHPHPDLPAFDYLEVATAPVVIAHLDAGEVDLAVLDGEAAPTGGLGLAKQLKDEIPACPPLVVLTARADDAWLANWSRADAASSHPIDPFHLTEAVTGALRGRPAA
ncbi:Rv3143 family two-component system response regulator [Nocardia sp. NPDC003482]